MNLTVGPHPPAVYWRRRAIVGAPLLLILVLFSSCIASGSDGAAKKPTTVAGANHPTPTRQASPEPTHACTLSDPCEPLANPSASIPAALGGAAQPLLTDSPSSSPSPSPSKAAPAKCADADVGLTAVVEKPKYAVGSMPRFRLVIENVSAKPCIRDVGASQQELRVTQGAQRLWSSDDCSPNHGSDVRLLQAGEKRTYWLTWSGKSSAPGCPKTRVLLGPGAYQLSGRLAAVMSKPVTFNITR